MIVAAFFGGVMVGIVVGFTICGFIEIYFQRKKL